jgi:hypothetical protein
VFEKHDVSLKGSSLVGQIPNVFGGQAVHVDQDGVKVGLKGLILKKWKLFLLRKLPNVKSDNVFFWYTLVIKLTK